MQQEQGCGVGRNPIEYTVAPCCLTLHLVPDKPAVSENNGGAWSNGFASQPANEAAASGVTFGVKPFAFGATPGES